jgi:hypothetical protein
MLTERAVDGDDAQCAGILDTELRENRSLQFGIRRRDGLLRRYGPMVEHAGLLSIATGVER